MGLLRKLLGDAMSVSAEEASTVVPEARGSVGAERCGLLEQANSLCRAGRHGDALALTSQALVSAPEDAELLFARASIFFDWGRFREARDACMQAASAGMQGTALELQLGWAHFNCGNAVAAEACMRRAYVRSPDDPRCLAGLAMILFRMGRFGEAEAATRSALVLSPGDFECLWIIGNCRLNQGDPIAAEQFLRLAVAADSGRAVGWKDLGAALNAQDRLEEAIKASETAVALDLQYGGPSDSFVNLAIELAGDGRAADAIALHERMLPEVPEVYGHIAYAQALLRAGRLEEGWNHLEFRFLNDAFLPRRQNFGRPVWSGQDLKGKTVLLLAEQGLGDLIQFIRYAPRLKALGAYVMLRVPDGIEAFAQGFPGVDRVLERGTTRTEFDYYLYVMSLPRAFGTGIDSIPFDAPYVQPDPARAAQWSSRIGSDTAFKVGLVWAGNPRHVGDRHRSIPLATLAPLGNLQALRFYALQKGSREEEAAAPPPGFTVQNLGPELRDFGETAAAISQLDLVLSVDTSVAHLAGAMGKPVWLMLPKAADWRWLEHREESPWYPTMRLFRQRVQGEWSEVVERVGATLHALRNGGKSLPAANVVAPVELVPTVARSTHITGQLAAMSAVAETRMGALQYLPDEPLVGDSLRWYGELLQPQLDLLVPMVRPASTVLEVGAGVGAHALALAVAAGDEGHLILYESNPVARRILRKNLDVNRVGNVTLMRWTCSAGASAQPSLESLDELQLDRLHLLKVNDAAAVTDVLTGAVATLWRLRPLLFLAVEDESALTGTAVRIRECGYRCWRVETPWFNPRNFNRRDDDMFAGRAALALLAIPEESDTGVAQSGFVELS